MSLAKGQPLTARRTRPGKKHGLIWDIHTNGYSYLLVLPAFLYVLVFSYCSYPFLVMAFEKFSYTSNLFNSPWVGLKNFEFFFKSNAALAVTWNTLKLNLLFISFSTVVSIVLALALNEMKNKFILRVNQAVMLFPNYLSWVVVSYMIWTIFSTEYGILNHILATLGSKKTINWYMHPEYWTTILVVMRVWKTAGINAVIFLAAITGIDDTLYESAMIDGASRWKQTWKITLPLIAPTIAIITLLSVGRIMYGDFGMIYSIIGDRGVLYSSTDVIDTYVYRAFRGSTGDPNQATAIGVFQALIGFLMVFSSNWVVRKFFKEGALY